jgi:hypothetical protein
MGVAESYLSKVGVQTGNAMKTALFELLLNRYRNTYEGLLAEKFAASVVNRLFCEVAADPELQTFVTENSSLIESQARELAKEDGVCWALTNAVYCFCYGKYVDSGGKVGMFSHPFLGYVRALQRVIGGHESPNFLDFFESRVGHASVEPLLNLWELGLYKYLPETPDSKLVMSEVASFVRSVKSSALK